jgi:hypothetical protein
MISTWNGAIESLRVRSLVLLFTLLMSHIKSMFSSAAEVSYPFYVNWNIICEWQFSELAPGSPKHLDCFVNPWFYYYLPLFLPWILCVCFVCCHLSPWRRRQHVSPKRRYRPANSHGAKTQDFNNNRLNVVKISEMRNKDKFRSQSSRSSLLGVHMLLLTHLLLQKNLHLH